jgi:hypothetical protein
MPTIWPVHSILLDFVIIILFIGKIYEALHYAIFFVLLLFDPFSFHILIKIWFVTVVPNYLNCATFSKDLLAIFMLCFWPTFWWRDMNTYLVFFVFPSRPTRLPTSITALVFFFKAGCLLLHFLPIGLHQRRPDSDLSHWVPVPPGILGPSWWLIRKQRWKTRRQSISLF